MYFINSLFNDSKYFGFKDNISNTLSKPGTSSL